MLLDLGVSRVRITLLRRLAWTFASILISTWSKDMGLYDSGYPGSFPGLGKRTIIASLIEGSSMKFSKR